MTFKSPTNAPSLSWTASRSVRVVEVHKIMLQSGEYVVTGNSAMHGWALLVTRPHKRGRNEVLKRVIAA